ncbi:MAG TPA: DUF4328 domain-containing protein [Hymenobacter sp.]|jgi:hypothetical protein
MLRDNNDRAEQAIVVFWCVVLVNAVSLLFGFVHLAILDSSGFDTIVNMTAGLLTLMHLTILVLSVTYFIRWFRRAYANLERAGIVIEHEEKWAAGAWFVPFMNLARPYSIMREIWRDTQLLARDSVQPHTLLNWWWTAFLVKNVVTNISSRMTSGAETLIELHSAVIANLFDSSFKIISALLTIAVIRRVRDFEQQLALRQQVEAIGAPAPEPVDVGATEEELYY